MTRIDQFTVSSRLETVHLDQFTTSRRLDVGHLATTLELRPPGFLGTTPLCHCAIGDFSLRGEITPQTGRDPA